MRGVNRVFVGLLILVSVAVFEPGRAQAPGDSASRRVSATIATKKPAFAGACRACPWGILAKVTADALRCYG